MTCQDEKALGLDSVRRNGNQLASFSHCLSLCHVQLISTVLYLICCLYGVAARPSSISLWYSVSPQHPVSNAPSSRMLVG